MEAAEGFAFGTVGLVVEFWAKSGREAARSRRNVEAGFISQGR